MPGDLAQIGMNGVLERVQRGLALDLSGESSSDFDLNNDSPNMIPKYRPAAVLIPLQIHNSGLRVVLTKRAAHLKHHPGQVSFPGGKVDACDANDQDAALREAWEEIALLRKDTKIIGRLPPHKTVTGFEVQPFVATVADTFTPRSDPNEVEEVFTVPLEHVLNPDNYFIEGRIWMGHMRRYYVVPFGPYYIWGATARMLRMFADKVARGNGQ